MSISALRRIFRLLRRVNDARDRGEIPYLVEDRIGRQSVLVLRPGEQPPEGAVELRDREDDD